MNGYWFVIRALRLFGLTMEQMIGGTAMNPAWNVIHPTGART